MVKQTTAANVAMFLVVLGWSLAFYGAMSQLGDFPPSMPRSHIEAVRHFSLAILFGGALCLFGSLWLSAYAFTVAKVRTVLTVAAVVIPSIALFGKIF